LNYYFFNYYKDLDIFKNKRTGAVFDGLGAIYDGRGNLIDGERYSARTYEIYADVLGIGNMATIVTGLRVDRLRRELGQLMDRLKGEHRVTTQEDSLIEDSETALLQGIKERGDCSPQLLQAHAEMYKIRFDDTGRRSYLHNAIKWLETAIDLLDSNALNRGQWLGTLSVYRLQTCSRM
jgi:hypothetical protein